MKSIAIFKRLAIVCALQSLVGLSKAVAEVNLAITAKTSLVESDNTAVYHSSRPLLIGNDGSAATGGFNVWSLDGGSPLKKVAEKATGRSKLVATVYNVGGKDLILTIAQPDSIFRVFDVDGIKEIKEAQKTVTGDWSALCTWKSPISGNQYVYLFGKKQAIQFLVRKCKDGFEIIEIQTFDVGVEASSCAISSAAESVYFSADDDKKVYTIKTAESVVAPKVSVLGKADDDVTGLAVYVGKSSDSLLVAVKDAVIVYSANFSLLGSMKLTGAEDIEIQGLALYQEKSKQYPAGLLTYAIEDEEGKAFGISSLEAAFKELNLETNLKFDPTAFATRVLADRMLPVLASPVLGENPAKTSPVLTSAPATENASEPTNANATPAGEASTARFCSSNPSLKTQANGGDGDDPAIWISPKSPDQSRIITTTKSEQGAGLGVFDLEGKLLQTIAAGEPNNVDMIYGFKLGNDRLVDLAFAACRADDTLCLFEMSADGVLSNIPGGSQAVVPDYKVYGSCVYRSPKTGTQYLFVNNKKAVYLQYVLTSSSNGTLSVALVRTFSAGSGGQVEGCVVDNENGFLFVGEEPTGLWRYDAEPGDSFPKGVKVASVATYSTYQRGDLYADVEGVTLIPGKKASEGFLIVSCQGVSAYNVYERAPPHEFVQTFTITDSADGSVDHVSNTDGIAAVGNRLNSQFPAGLVVTHDDANELPGGKTSDKASFKLVSLADVLKGQGLLDRVDKEWNPRL